MTYVYKCVNCGVELELQQAITDEPYEFYRHTPAPLRLGIDTLDNFRFRGENAICSGEVQRIITGPVNFVLKGGGWASDGYSKDH